ncbi:hypothetical protein Emag_001354 [Eimeria magna]
MHPTEPWKPSPAACPEQQQQQQQTHPRQGSSFPLATLRSEFAAPKATGLLREIMAVEQAKKKHPTKGTKQPVRLYFSTFFDAVRHMLFCPR